MVGAAGLGGEADLAGAVGGDALAAVLGEGFVDFAQGVDVELGNDESAVAGESTAENAGRLDDLVDTGLDHLAQLGAGAGAAHTAVDVQRNRARLTRDAQARKKRVVGESWKS